MSDIEPSEIATPKAAPKRKPAAKKTPTTAEVQAEGPKVAPKRKPAAKKTAPAAVDATSVKAETSSKNGSTTTTPSQNEPVATSSIETPSAVDRAEDTLDELGKKVGTLFASATTRLRKAAAVGREELEDLWAEAQSIRRGDTK
jgi:hypothetical protein